MIWYNLYVVILGELKLQLNMRMWRNRQTRWLRVTSRQCIYYLYWLKRVYRFDICGATCKKVHLGFGFEPCKNFRSLYCGCGGIGRRAGFRCQSSQGGMGSSPFIRTKLSICLYCRLTVFLFNINLHNFKYLIIFWSLDSQPYIQNKCEV